MISVDRLQPQTGCYGIKVFQRFWLIGAFWVFSTILMLFPWNHFFDIAGCPVVLWLQFLVFETFCCVWQAGQAFCSVCCGRTRILEEYSMSIGLLWQSWDSRGILDAQRLSLTELGTRIHATSVFTSLKWQLWSLLQVVIGSIWFRLWMRCADAVLLRIFKILSFCAAGKNAQSRVRETVKT